MAIEIKQLIIRAVVEERHERPDGTGPRSAGSRTAAEPTARATPPDTGVDREALIVECTRQVLRELRKGRGR